MKKINMNKMAAVAAAVMMAAIGYVAGKANTPTTIEPANIIVAHAAIEEQVEETVEPEIIEEQVEDEKETFRGLIEVHNNDYGRTVYEYIVVTEEGHYYDAAYMGEAISIINELCGRNLRYDEQFGHWQVTDNDTGKAVPIKKVVMSD